MPETLESLSGDMLVKRQLLACSLYFSIQVMEIRLFSLKVCD